jgi:cytochrome c peroxidase
MSQNRSIHARFLVVAAVLVMASVGQFVSQDATAADQAQGTSQRNDAAAIAAFEAMVPVLRHPRCMNCHSRGDFPRQGDDSHLHAMNVRRGADGKGVTAQKCSACHQEQNTAGLNMPPGAPDWHLPPANMPMIWEGLSNPQLCELFKDPRQNGHRTQLAQLVEHAQAPLVAWGWHPGEGRTAIPGTHTEFVAKMKEWADEGGGCPVR